MRGGIIAKFGGTSMGTAEAIEQVAQIVLTKPQPRVVTLSAVGDTTDRLVELCHTKREKRQNVADKLLKAHVQVAEDLGLSINSHIEDLIAPLYRLSALDVLNMKEQDTALALGEDLSCLLLYSLLHKKEDAEVEYLDARRFLITDASFGEAKPHTEAIRGHLEALLEDKIYVTQGFVGATSGGQTTTLGRGGSDHSAALIAEALGSEALRIYTDVPGVCTIDPKVSGAAQSIRALSFREMSEMAYFGAKVLHPATLMPCIRAKIPVYILSTFALKDAGTRISVLEESEKTPRIRAITIRKEQMLVTIKSPKMLNAYGFLSKMFAILANYRISVDLITTSEVSVALTIDATNHGAYHTNPFLKEERLMQELGEIAEVSVEEGLTLLAVVGYGLKVPGVVQKILGLVEDKKVRLVCYGASNSSIGMLVEAEEATSVARKLHEKLLEERSVL